VPRHGLAFAGGQYFHNFHGHQGNFEMKKNQKFERSRAHNLFSFCLGGPFVMLSSAQPPSFVDIAFERAANNNAVVFTDHDEERLLLILRWIQRYATPAQDMQENQQQTLNTAAAADISSCGINGPQMGSQAHTVQPTRIHLQPKVILTASSSSKMLSERFLQLQAMSDLVVGHFQERQDDQLMKLRTEFIRYQVLILPLQVIKRMFRQQQLRPSEVALIIVEDVDQMVKLNDWPGILTFVKHIRTVGFAQPTALGHAHFNQAHSLSWKKVVDELELHLVYQQSEQLLHASQPRQFTISHVSSDSSTQSNLSSLSVGSYDSPAAKLYCYYLNIIIQFYNAAATRETLSKLQRLLDLIAELKQDLGIWCAGQLAYAYVKAMFTHRDKVGEKRKRNDLEEDEDAMEIDAIPADMVSLPPIVEPALDHISKDDTISHSAFTLRKSFVLPEVLNLKLPTDMSDGDFTPKTIRLIQYLTESSFTGCIACVAEKRTTSRTVYELVLHLQKMGILKDARAIAAVDNSSDANFWALCTSQMSACNR
jgi:hypothetical protein